MGYQGHSGRLDIPFNNSYAVGSDDYSYLNWGTKWYYGCQLVAFYIINHIPEFLASNILCHRPNIY
jgi:hypothetical protein